METDINPIEWVKKIESSYNHEREWRRRGKEIVKRYRDEDRGHEGAPRYNILFANVEVLSGVLYQRTPAPVVRRRYLDNDPVGRQAAQILQRALGYVLDGCGFDEVVQAAVKDRLLPGRGLIRVRYKPYFETRDIPQPVSESEIGTDEMGMPILPEGAQLDPLLGPVRMVRQDVKVYEEVFPEYVPWTEVVFSPCETWKKLKWVCFRHVLDRQELQELFGAEVGAIVLDWQPKEGAAEEEKKAVIYEVWDKKTRRVFYITRSNPRILREDEDPLALEDFFPIPKPILSVCTNGNLTPVPDYLEYQDQAQELDLVIARISALTDALRHRGVYDASHPEVGELSDAPDNRLIPINNYSQFVDGGGLKSALQYVPLGEIASVLQGLYQQRDACKAIIYEITGISDIVRGSTRVSETATAQEIKARYAGSRIAPHQKAIAEMCRDMLRMMGEIIAEQFDIKTLKMVTGEDMWIIDGQDATEQIYGLLSNEKLRGFRVDIETDSTVAADEQEEKKSRNEFLQSVVQFIGGVAPLVKGGVLPIEVARGMLEFGARAYKVGPQLEELLGQIGQKQEAPPQAGAPIPPMPPQEGNNAIL